MKAVVLYARSASLGGLLIRHHDNVAPGRWSHGAVLLWGQVVEAHAIHGVRSVPLAEFEAAHSRVERVEYDVKDADAGEAWLLEQIGKGYDYLAVFGRMFRRSWQEPGRWHCQELVEAYLARCGRQRFRDAPNLITPNLGYMVL
jgi:uncharacterized protein YycO